MKTADIVVGQEYGLDWNDYAKSRAIVTVLEVGLPVPRRDSFSPKQAGTVKAGVRVRITEARGNLRGVREETYESRYITTVEAVRAAWAKADAAIAKEDKAENVCERLKALGFPARREWRGDDVLLHPDVAEKILIELETERQRQKDREEWEAGTIAADLPFDGTQD